MALEKLIDFHMKFSTREIVFFSKIEDQYIGLYKEDKKEFDCVRFFDDDKYQIYNSLYEKLYFGKESYYKKDNVTFYSINYYLNLIQQNDLKAMSLLFFSPKDILVTSKDYEFLVINRDKLISKDFFRKLIKNNDYKPYLCSVLNKEEKDLNLKEDIKLLSFEYQDYSQNIKGKFY